MIGMKDEMKLKVVCATFARYGVLVRCSKGWIAHLSDVSFKMMWPGFEKSVRTSQINRIKRILRTRYLATQHQDGSEMKTMTLLLILVGLISPAFADDTEKYSDTRVSLEFPEAERADFLSEMRQMLISIQGVISGIADEDPEKIIQAAKHSGNRMARATPESIKRKTPVEFKEIGGPTHMMFEELAIRAEADDMQTLTEFTGKLMQQCISCHAMFKTH